MNDGEREISFNRGVPATQSLPGGKIGAVAEEVMDRYGEPLLQYGDSRGFSPLINRLADWYGDIEANRILVANGSLQILDMIANLTLSQGDNVLVESPSYDRAIKIFRRAGAEVHGVKLEKDGPDLAVYRELLRKKEPEIFYSIPDFQNPTGISTSTKKRKQLVKLAAAHETLVVEDSPYRRLRYRGEEKPSLRSFDSQVVAQISSFSKLIGPGIRVGWVVGTEELVNDLAKYAEDTYITPGLLSQGVVNRLLEDGWLEENIKDLISLYGSRLDATLGSLEEHFPQAEWVEARGGFFVGLWLPGDIEEKEYYAKARDRGLVFSSSKGFFPDQRSEGFIRLPFPALSPKEIERGIRRMGEVYRSM